MATAWSSHGLKKTSSVARGIRYHKNYSNSFSELHLICSFLTHFFFEFFVPWFPGGFQSILSRVICRPILLFHAFHFPSRRVSGNFETLDSCVRCIPPRLSHFFSDFPELSHSSLFVIFAFPCVTSFTESLWRYLISFPHRPLSKDEPQKIPYRFTHMSKPV
jgi:hypothetical protein